MPCQAPRLLFQSADVEVRHVPAGDGARHVVTFDRFHDERRMGRAGYAEDFLAKRGIAATHVMTLGNDWFQYPEMPEALAQVHAATRGARRVMTYGSSMGGYGALRFADAVGAHAALALSPQYSVDPRKVPWERRWAQDQRRIRFLPELDGTLRCKAHAVAVYDPRDLDGRHAALIGADGPVIRIQVPFAGHPAGAYLNEARLLERLVLDTLDGTLDAAAIERRLRQARRRLGTYFGVLALAQPAWRPRLAIALGREATRLSPGQPDLLHFLARRLAAHGDLDEALAVHARVAALDRNPGYLIGYSHDLHVAGHTAAALDIAHEVRRALPGHAGILRWLADLHHAQGDLPGAIDYAGQALALDPGNDADAAFIEDLRAILPPPPPPPIPPPREVYRSETLLVRHVPAGDPTRHAVTFDAYHDEPGLDRAGFGEDHFFRHGIDATHILTRSNDWYQYPDLPLALAAAREAASGAAAVLSYGSSMGGYAAVRFADAVGATAALALSPQYSVDPARMPEDLRWGADGRRIRFLPEVDGPVRSRIRPVIAYDPHGPDCLHADRLAADIPVQRLRVPWGGHPAGTYLQDAGLLGPLLEALLAGSFDADATEQAIRAARRDTSIYFANLAARQPACRPKLGVALAEAAVRLAPGRRQPLLALARRQFALGRIADARATYDHVLADARHPPDLLALSQDLMAAGALEAALPLAQEAQAAWPHHAGLHHHLADLHTALGRVDQAVRHAEQALALDPANAGYQVLVPLLRARARPWSPLLRLRAAQARRRWRAGRAGQT